MMVRRIILIAVVATLSQSCADSKQVDALAKRAALEAEVNTLKTSVEALFNS
jgi:hypothetical protein